MDARARARARRLARGVSAVEGAVIFAIGGSLLAVFVPAFARELNASRFAEPVLGLTKLSAAAVAYAHDRPVRDAFPPTAPLTPQEPPRGVRAVDPPGAWDTPTWRALGFRPVAEGIPHLFAFGFDSATAGGINPETRVAPTRPPGPVKSTFIAHAHGDLDGDGVRSTFEIRGHCVEDDPAGPAIDPGMYVESEVE